MCDSLFTTLEQSHFKPIKQNLLSTGNNILPYNIYLNKNSLNPISSNIAQQNLLFIIKQEDTVDNIDLILEFTRNFLNDDSNFSNINKTILFSYGDDYQIDKGTNIQGAVHYFNSLSSISFSSNNTSVVILDFSAEKNIILSHSGGMTSSSDIIKKTFNSALQTNIKFNLPFSYLSNLYTYDATTDSILDIFLSQKISSIKINFSKDFIKTSPDKVINLLNNLSNSLQNNPINDYDQHFLLIRVPGKKYISISEHATVIIIITIILSFLLFLFLFTFINNRIAKENWLALRKIWYIVPILFAILLLSLFLGNFIAKALFKNKNFFYRSLFTAAIQFILSFIFTGVFNSIELLFNKRYISQSFDYLVIFCTFINQFIFIYLDVAFFPVFMFICILSIISHIFKNKYIKLIFALIMILPALAYIRTMIIASATYNFDIFNQFSGRIFIFFALFFYPIYLIIICFINSYLFENISTKKIILVNGIITFTLCIITFILATSSYQIDKKRYEIKKTEVVELNDSENLNQIKLNYKDKNIFDNTIRTLNIVIPETTEECQIIISTPRASPILYSDNSFVNINKNLSEFIIPQNPPENLVFSYGIPEKDSQIKIIVYIKSNSNSSSFSFNRIEKSYIIK